MTDLAATPRRRNARGEGEKLREQLLAATVDLLDAEGDAARVSVRAIAKAAGVSPNAIYLHFPDRDALVSAAVDRGFEAFNGALEDGVPSGRDPVERLRAMALAYLDFSRRQPALYAVLFSTRRPIELAGSIEPDDPRRVVRLHAFEGLVAAVAAVAPDAAPAEASDLAMLLWSALHGYATLRANRVMSGWPEPEAYVDQLVRAHLTTASG